MHGTLPVPIDYIMRPSLYKGNMADPQEAAGGRITQQLSVRGVKSLWRQARGVAG